MTRNNKSSHSQSSVCHGLRACQPLRRLRRRKALPSDWHICRATRSQSLICVLLGGPSKLVDLSFGNSRFLKAVAAIIIARNAPRPPLVAAFFPGIICTVHSDVILYAPVSHRCDPYLSVVCPAANCPGTILRHGPIVDLLLCCDSKLREFVLLPSVCCCWYCHFPALAAGTVTPVSHCLRFQALREVALRTPLYRWCNRVLLT